MCVCVCVIVVCWSRRHRLSEADEDEELLEGDDLEDPTITRFSENPYCEWRGGGVTAA